MIYCKKKIKIFIGFFLTAFPLMSMEEVGQEERKEFWVHATNFFPVKENGAYTIKAQRGPWKNGTKFEEKYLFRPSVHGSLNMVCPAHDYWDWANRKIAIVIRLKDLKDRILSIDEFDTAILGDLPLPSGSTILYTNAVSEAVHNAFPSQDSTKLKLQEVTDIVSGVEEEITIQGGVPSKRERFFPENLQAPKIKNYPKLFSLVSEQRNDLTNNTRIRFPGYGDRFGAPFVSNRLEWMWDYFGLLEEDSNLNDQAVIGGKFKLGALKELCSPSFLRFFREFSKWQVAKQKEQIMQYPKDVQEWFKKLEEIVTQAPNEPQSENFESFDITKDLKKAFIKAFYGQQDALKYSYEITSKSLSALSSLSMKEFQEFLVSFQGFEGTKNALRFYFYGDRAIRLAMQILVMDHKGYQSNKELIPYIIGIEKQPEKTREQLLGQIKTLLGGMLEVVRDQKKMNLEMMFNVVNTLHVLNENFFNKGALLTFLQKENINIADELRTLFNGEFSTLIT